MSNNSLKNFIIKFFFIFVTLFNLFIFESNGYSNYDYCYYPGITSIELVVHSFPTYNLQSFKYDSSLKFKKLNYTPFNCVSFALTGLPILFYSHSYTPPILNNQHTFSPQHHIISFLQKKNIWHQSSDDDPSHS
jgi:hypothetical protein